ncbi:MAG: hypothetical protein KAT70_07175 [Thermoplasmata archaeon]|nr:hypothetical protein [Thermoplasmata archaeon]
MTDLEAVIAAWITVFAFALFVVSAISYRRVRNPRVLMIGLAFLAFFIKGLVMSIGVVRGEDAMEGYIPILDLAVLLLLASAVLLRRDGQGKGGVDD